MTHKSRNNFNFRSSKPLDPDRYRYLPIQPKMLDPDPDPYQMNTGSATLPPGPQRWERWRGGRPVPAHPG
jgi:hypothetical protein